MEEALIKRILPHSIEAEQSVIGSMILDREPIMKYIRNWVPIRLHTDEKRVYILRSGRRMHSLFL